MSIIIMMIIIIMTMIKAGVHPDASNPVFGNSSPVRLFPTFIHFFDAAQTGCHDHDHDHYNHNDDQLIIIIMMMIKVRLFPTFVHFFDAAQTG